MREVTLVKLRFAFRLRRETLGLSSAPYFGDASGLWQRTWYPILDDDIAVTIRTSTEHDSDSSTDTFGSIRAINGGDADFPHVLEILRQSQVRGQEVEVRRGFVGQSWDEMEIWMATQSDQLTSEDQIFEITQRSRWKVLDRAVNDKSFTSTPDNPSLTGKVVPNILGFVHQIGPLELVPNRLIYFLADNAQTGEGMVVRQGGVELVRDDPAAGIEGQFIGQGKLVTLLRNPSLPLTFDLAGQTTPTTTIVEGETPFPMTSGDGVNPDGFTMFSGGANVTFAGSQMTISASVGIGGSEVNLTFGAPTPLTGATWTINGQNASSEINDGTGTDFTSASLSWSSPSATFPAEGNWRLKSVDFDFAAADLSLENIWIDSGLVNFDVITTIPGDQSLGPVTRTASSSATAADFSTLSNVEIFAQVSAPINGTLSTVEYGPISATFEQVSDQIATMYSSAILEPAQAHTIRLFIESMASGSIYLGSSPSIGGPVTRHTQVNRSGVQGSTVVPTGEHLVLEFVPVRNGAQLKLDQIGISTTQTITGQLPLIVAWMIERIAELRPTDTQFERRNIAFESLNSLNQKTANPLHGWYVTGGETVREMLDLFIMDSASGIWTRDHDGVLRFGLWRWQPPSDPTAIDTGIVSTRFGTYEAKRVTSRTVGGKNWVPLQRDQMAGITTTFEQRERSLIMEEFRWWRVGQINGELWG